MLAFFKSLANESRLRMVGLLLKRPHHVKELAAELQLKEPTVCHHLSYLAQVGLVEMSAKGNAHYYSLRGEELRDVDPPRIAGIVVEPGRKMLDEAT